MYNVSIIIASYQPNYNKLLYTINSILNQKTVSFEIIITDDGSQETYFDHIKTYFNSIGFVNYKFITHEYNIGTCENIYDALKKVTGKYVKIISPGDCLYNKETLYKWFIFMEKNNCDISFGEIINYHFDKNNKFYIDKVPIRPRLLKYYISKEYKYAKQSYLLLSDAPVGAAFFEKTDILKKYLRLILGKVKYAEDYVVKLMLLDNIQLMYHKEKVIWYEYGTGISTCKNDKQKQLLNLDLIAINKIIINRYKKYQGFCKKYVFYLNICEKSKTTTSLLKYIFFPYLFISSVTKKLYNNYSSIDDSEKQYKDIVEINLDRIEG